MILTRKGPIFIHPTDSNYAVDKYLAGKTFGRAARLADPNQRLWGATARRRAHQKEVGQEPEHL